MPIYEYKCDNGHLFDVMQRMSDAPLTDCIECGAPVRKVLQPVGISFKGSGFYSTDYSSKPRSSDLPAKNGDSAPSGSGESKPSESGSSSTNGSSKEGSSEAKPGASSAVKASKD